MEEILTSRDKKNKVLKQIDNQIFWSIEFGNKDQSTRDNLRMCSYYAYYNYGILEDIMDCKYNKFGEFDDYLEFIKRRCEALKESDSNIDKTDEYLYFEAIIKENLEQLKDCDLKRELSKNLLN